jgi:hypothetical protein
MPPQSIWTRLVALFLVGSSLWSAGLLILADSNPSLRPAQNLEFAPALLFGGILYFFVALTAGVSIWWRWKGGVKLGTVALAIYAALACTRLQAGQPLALGVAAALCLTPLLILWWRQAEFPE